MSTGATAPAPWDDYLKPAVYTSIIGGVALAVGGRGEMGTDLAKSVALLAGANILGNFISYSLVPGTVIFADARFLPSITGGLLYAGGEHFVHPNKMGKHLTIGIGANLAGNYLARGKVSANALLTTLDAQKKKNNPTI